MGRGFAAPLLLSLAAGLAMAQVAAHAAAGSPERPAVRVMSFNLRFDNPDDGEDAWPNRKEKAASMVRFHGADLVGVQEALRAQLDDLARLLPEFGWFGVGRDANGGGEHSAILYRRERFEVLGDGTFWLSEAPEVKGSLGWDAALPRIVTWGRLRDLRSGAVLHAFNTHFDHRGEDARRRSAGLLLRKIDEIAGRRPTVVTGDFNATPDAEPYRVVTGNGRLRDALLVSRSPHHGPTSSWNGFKTIEPGRRIDFVFVSPEVDVLRHGILSDTFDGRFPSDHLPVLAEVALAP